MRPAVRFLACLVTSALLPISSARAVTSIVGDPDGFGIDPAGLVRATGLPHDQPADVDGDGIIEGGEYLPDWNMNGSCAVGSGDAFDFRDAAELAATNGAQYTDRDMAPGGASDGIEFIFEFAVPVAGDIDFGVGHFINFIFGDYDVQPAEIEIDGLTVSLTTQGGGNDGLVQSAFATIPWEDMLDGQVVITMIAPNEPYLTFDYALMDLSRLSDADGDGIPDSVDDCPGIANTNQADGDGDGAGDACDNCLDVSNPDQVDSDSDGQGNLCDPCPQDATDDGDGDGYCAPEDCFEGSPDVHPGALEDCVNGVDDDCDGAIDTDDTDCPGDDDDDAAPDDDDSGGDDDDSDGGGFDDDDDDGWNPTFVQDCGCEGSDPAALGLLLALPLGLWRRRA